jgi:hypothetical protein
MLISLANGSNIWEGHSIIQMIGLCAIVLLTAGELYLMFRRFFVRPT